MLHSFASAEGSDPSPSSSLATDGTALFGTARLRGPGLANGTLYRCNLDGSGFTVLHVFTNSPDGANPAGGLVVKDGTIYGSTTAGGPSPGYGMLYSLNTNGSDFKLLHSFHGSSDGETPRGDLLLVGDTLFGTTSLGGVWNGGVVYSMDISGSNFTVLHNFTNYNPNLNHRDGAIPYAGLTLSGSTLYGTTTRGGTNADMNAGTVYKLNTNGTGYALLHSFTNSPAPDGINPIGRLVVNGDMIYGTATYGSTNVSQSNYGSIFSLNTNGGNFTVMHSFDPFTGGDGGYPFAGMTLVGDTLYGTASEGGSTGLIRYGALFAIQTDGSGYHIAHQFTNALTGAIPYSGLLPYSGALYGTTSGGGAAAPNPGNISGTYGTIFSFVPAVQFSLQTSNSPAGLVISWPDDGLIHDLQTTTNLGSANWSSVVPNWTNGSQIGFIITNTSIHPQAFFRLK